MGASVSQRLCSIMFGVALVSACQTASAVRMEAAPLAVSADACKRDPDPYFRSTERALHVTPENAQQVREICREVTAHPGRVNASQLVNAYYFVAAANRVLFEAGPSPDAERLNDAEDALNRALSFSENFHYARLERARVYRLQARLTNAQATRRAALAEVEELQRRIPNTGDPVHAAAHFLRASIFLDLPREDAGGPREEDAIASIGGRPLTNNTHEDVLPTLTWDSTLRDLAVFADSAHAWSPEHREHPDRAAALEYLARYANQMGCFLIPCGQFQIAETWRGEPLTRESVQRAIDYLSMAQIAVDAVTTSAYAHPQFVETYTYLGKAKTHLAGLLGSAAAANYGCVPEVANEAMLAQAASDLSAARDRSAVGSAARQDAELGLACAALAAGDISAARAAAEVSTGSGSAASHLMLARVHAARAEWPAALASYTSANDADGSLAARGVVNLERARALLEAPPQELLADEAFAGKDGVWTVAESILAQAHPSPRERPVAQLELGKLHYFMGLDTQALHELEVFQPQHEAGAYENRNVRAQALLFLSRIRTRLGAGNDAVRNADDAFALDSSWPYREQACLARIRFDRLSFSQSGPRAICAPADDSPLGEGSLLEGMYHLRRAFLLRGNDREREWEDAYRAFNQGFESLRNAGSEPRIVELRDRLQYGRGTAQYCIGFAEIGNQDIQAIGNEGRISHARGHFQQFRIADCPARR